MTSPDPAPSLSRAATVFVAGGSGLVGSALRRALSNAGFEDVRAPGHDELDLTRGEAVDAFFAEARPQYVFLAAARVGGIRENDARPAEFIRDNLAIQTNVIHAAHEQGTERLLFLGSSCMYPKLAPQPAAEAALLTGPLEPTNEPYAVAKIAGTVMCRAYQRQFGDRFVVAVPTGLYGPGDNFDLASCHVLPALIRRFHEAKLDAHAPVTLWGSGAPLRELLYVDDAAQACLTVLDRYPGGGPINIGAGEEVSIRDLATLVQAVVGHEGEVRWDTSKPDGTPRKLLASEKITALGWEPRVPLREGIERTYRWYCEEGPGKG